MSTPQNPADTSRIPAAIPPNCPACKKPMPMVALFAYQIEMLIIPALLCPYCHALLHIEIVRPEKSTSEQPPAPQSPLWKPS